MGTNSSSYLGCFSDYVLDRDLPFKYLNTSLLMYIESCVTACFNLGYSLAGLQSGYLKFRGRIEHEDDENLRNIINGCKINTEMPN